MMTGWPSSTWKLEVFIFPPFCHFHFLSPQNKVYSSIRTSVLPSLCFPQHRYSTRSLTHLYPNPDQTNCTSVTVWRFWGDGEAMYGRWSGWWRTRRDCLPWNIRMNLKLQLIQGSLQWDDQYISEDWSSDFILVLLRYLVQNLIWL